MKNKENKKHTLQEIAFFKSADRLHTTYGYTQSAAVCIAMRMCYSYNPLNKQEDDFIWERNNNEAKAGLN